jgi:hypothetical protein
MLNNLTVIVSAAAVALGMSASGALAADRAPVNVKSLPTATPFSRPIMTPFR